jgi:hypothetical protein
MNAARNAHTATRLTDGRVLVVGGGGNDNLALASAELFDPATGTWTLTGSLGAPRFGHQAALLADGRVLVVGGDAGGPPPDFGRTSSAEIYDPASGTWAPTGSMAITRGGHTATALADGTVLVAGGWGDRRGSDSTGWYEWPLEIAEVYDPATGLWSTTGSLNAARYGHTATRLANGDVLIAGGSDDGDLMYTLYTVERYDPVLRTWSAVPHLNTNSILHTATLLPGGDVLVAGGYFWPATSHSRAELLDPFAATWSHTASLSFSRNSHTATLLPSGNVLVAGGQSWSSVAYPTPRTPPPTVVATGISELFEAGSGTWKLAGRLSEARVNHTATLLLDGRVLIAGGVGLSDSGWFDRAIGSAELYGDVEDCKNHYILSHPCRPIPGIR